MPTTFKSKYYFGSYLAADNMHSTAPILTQAAGGLITLLNAVLVDGFGIVPIQSISVASNGLATVVSSGHGYKVEFVNRVLIYGTTIPEINNSEWEIVSIVDANTYTFQTAITVPVTDSGATINSKFPSLGWTRPFGDAVGNVVVYRSADTSGNRPYLRIDAATIGVAKVSYYTSMTDINTGANRVPTTLQSANGVSWCYHPYNKTTAYVNADGSIGTWSIVGTSKFFYFNNVFGVSYWHRSAKWFGEFNPLGTNTTQNVIIRGNTNASYFVTGGNYANYFDSSGTNTQSGWYNASGNFLNYDLNMLQISKTCLFIPPHANYGGSLGNVDATYHQTPLKSSNMIYFEKPVYVASATDGVLGTLPGMATCVQNLHHHVAGVKFITDSNGIRYFLFWLGAGINTEVITAANIGAWYFDIDSDPTLT